uniref:Uncharacterized protein n=1 Tax=Anguilla anguilla TaxID=7936 RepID=A0A0E9WDU5_ANGAN
MYLPHDPRLFPAVFQLVKHTIFFPVIANLLLLGVWHS